VLSAIGIPGEHVEREGRHSIGRQSDELSESWVQSYLEDVSRR
jgi:hypothetical protein